MKDDRDRVQTLMEQHGFNLGTAQAYIESKGRCMYCGTDCLETTQCYWSSQVDHMLPKNKYPELVHEPKNMVLSCYSCNNLKRDLDILQTDQDLINLIDENKLTEAGQILEELRDKVIEAIQRQLKSRTVDRISDYETVKAIIMG